MIVIGGEGVSLSRGSDRKNGERVGVMRRRGSMRHDQVAWTENTGLGETLSWLVGHEWRADGVPR